MKLPVAPVVPFVLAGLLAAAAMPALARDPAPAGAAQAGAPKSRGDGEARARPAAAARADDPASIERLRERLADRLGATRPPDAPSRDIVRVVSRASSGDSPAAAVEAPRRPRSVVRAPAAAEKGAAVAAAGAAGHAAAAAGLPHWAYGGETGPQAWGGLRPEFARCGNGNRQSPIDIRDGIGVELEPVQFDYRATPFSVIDNGHTVQVDVRGGNAIQVGGRRYELVQFHFHRPSEERINGRQFEMSAHLVHRDPDGRLAVVALLLDRGGPAPVVQQVWNNLPLEKHEAVPGSGTIDLAKLLPSDARYYTYMGSLTTPPCTEGVLWIVMKQPVQVSAEQIDIFARLYPMNARPVQAAGGRLIKQSN